MPIIVTSLKDLLNKGKRKVTTIILKVARKISKPLPVHQIYQSSIVDNPTDSLKPLPDNINEDDLLLNFKKKNKHAVVYRLGKFMAKYDFGISSILPTKETYIVDFHLPECHHK